VIEPNQTQDAKSYWKQPENYVSLFTLLAVLTYTGMQIWQTWLIRQNNVVSQRAFVYVDKPQVILSKNPANNMTKTVVFITPLVNS
jgi:predicted negative regulator of RcsB-dependent stress response